MRTFTGAHCFFQIFTTMNFSCEIWHAHVKMRKKWSLILIGFFFTQAMESTQTFYTLNKVNLANFYNICFFHRQNPKILRNLIFSSTGPLEGVVRSREPDSTYDRPRNGRSDRTHAKKAIFRGRSTQNGRIDPKWSIRPKMVDRPNEGLKHRQ